MDRVLLLGGEGGDSLAVFPELVNHVGCYEARACALEGLPSSVQTTGVHPVYLSACQPVSRSEVPREWLRALT